MLPTLRIILEHRNAISQINFQEISSSLQFLIQAIIEERLNIFSIEFDVLEIDFDNHRLID